MIKNRLCSKKVLIVLDDINHSDHLEYLAGERGWFGNGSRVVITTRNRHLIEKDDAIIYEVPTLPNHEAMQLFNQHAFKKEVPNELFINLSSEVVNHAKGLPLALKVWGSLLHKKGLTQWRRTVDQIKRNSNSEIVENLKISYDGLELEEQEIFLDIACFFRGDEKEEVMQILESCDFGAEYGLDVLIDKSLVFLTEYNTIEMHDLIQDMGKYIVKIQKHPDDRSRLWDAEDFKELMVDNTGTKAMEAIRLEDIHGVCFNKKAMRNMTRLRLLFIFGFRSHDDSIEYLPNNLRWFECYNYPWKSLPENFEPKRLACLNLQSSSLRYLWTGTKHLPSLRKLYLNYSQSLIRTPDFTGMPNLEYLNLQCCSNLEEVHHSLGCSRKLTELDLKFCGRLKRFPCVNVESLESLYLHDCYSLDKFPKILGIMKPELEIYVGGSGIMVLPSSIIHPQARFAELHLTSMINLVALPSGIFKLKGLVKLNMSRCSKLKSLPKEIGHLENLVKLDVSYCSKLESLPEEIGDLENLEELDATWTLISRPPSSIVHLNKLKFLTFSKHKSEDGVFFVFPLVADGLRSLETLNLSRCNLIDGGLPADIGCLSSLQELYLTGTNFEHLPRSLAQFAALRSLDLLDCTRLTQLPEFPQQLDTIYADWSKDWICNSLFQNISSLQHDISASDSLSLRVFSTWHLGKNIPSWFHHQGIDTNVSVNLPKNWYVPGNFLGFAVCYSGSLIDTTAQLTALCNDGMSCMAQKFALSNHSKESAIIFFLVPFAGLWDTSKANGKTPNEYQCIKLSFSKELKEFGLRLLYKDERELEALLQLRRNNGEPTEQSANKETCCCLIT